MAYKEKGDLMLSPEILNVYPDTLALELALRREAEECNGSCMGRSHLLFAEMVNEILEDDSERRPVLGDLGRYLLLRELLAEAFRGSLADSSFCLPYSPGIVNKIAEILREWKEALLSPEDIKNILPNLHAAREKIACLLTLYEKYIKKCQTLGVWDEVDPRIRALEILRSGRLISFLEGFREIRFLNIYKYTELDFQIVLALSRILSRVGVVLPYNPIRQDAFRYLEGLIRKFENLGDEYPGVDLEFSAEPDLSEDGDLKSFILRHLFKPAEERRKSEPHPPDGSVVIAGLPGRAREMEEIAGEIRRLLEQGVEPRKIAVVFRSLSDYRSLTFQTFREFRLPSHLRYGAPLLSCHLIRTVLSPFLVLQSHFSVREVLNLVGSNYVDMSGIYPEPLSRGELEMLAAEAGIIDDVSTGWESALERLRNRLLSIEPSGEDHPQKDREKLLPLIDRAVLFIQALRRELAILEGPAYLAEWMANLRSFLEKLRTVEMILQYSPDDPGQNRKNDLLQIDLAAWRAFLELLDDIRRQGRSLRLERELGCGEFFDLLMEGVRRCSLEARAETDGIMILDAHSALSMEVDYLFLGGLVEGEFPKTRRENVLLRDDEKEMLEMALGRRIYLSARLAEWEESLLFYLLLHRARKSIYLSYSYMDEKGEILLPSYFLTSILRLIKKEPLRKVPSGSIVPSWEECFTPEQLQRRLNLDLWTLPMREERSLVLSFFKERYREFFLKIRRIVQLSAIEKYREDFFEAPSPGGCPWTGSIRTRDFLNLLRRRWGRDRVWSAGMLEDFGRCPMNFFFRRILSLEKVKMQELEVDRPAEGIFVHEILRNFYAACEKENMLPLRGDPKERRLLQKTLDEVFSRWSSMESVGDPLLWEIERRKVEKVLLGWMEWESREEGFIPRLFEVPFGPESKPVSLPAPGGAPIILRGRLDRIDVSPDERTIRVLDYKNSTASRYNDLVRDENIGVLSFQIPLYAYAARDLVHGLSAGAKGPSVVAGYACLREPKIVVQDFGNPEFIHYFKPAHPEGTRNLASEIMGIIEQIASGGFEPDPRDCRYCSFSDICRYEERKIQE